MRLHYLAAKIRKTVVCAALFSLFASLPALSDEKIPTELQEIGIDENVGQKIDLTLPFRDETGQNVTLKNYFDGQKPVLLYLVYYGCPNLCTMVLNGGIESMKGITWNPGENYEVVAISIDSREKPELAREKKAAYLKEFGRPETGKGWHFLTGDEPSVAAITKQIGFRYKWDEESQQFAHGSAIFVLTPEGKISRYLFGIQYPPRDLKFAMLEASQGKTGSFMDRIVLFCFRYDASTKKYVLLAERIMTAGGALTLLVMGFIFSRFWKHERTRLNAQRG
jgi:protein SCO1